MGHQSFLPQHIRSCTWWPCLAPLQLLPWRPLLGKDSLDRRVFWAGAADAEGFSFNHHSQPGCQNVWRGLDRPLTSSKDVNKGSCQISTKVRKPRTTKTKIEYAPLPSSSSWSPHLFSPWPCPFPAVTPGKHFFPWLLASKYIPPHYILHFLVFFTVSLVFNQYFALNFFPPCFVSSCLIKPIFFAASSPVLHLSSSESSYQRHKRQVYLPLCSSQAYVPPGPGTMCYQRILTLILILMTYHITIWNSSGDSCFEWLDQQQMQ